MPLVPRTQNRLSLAVALLAAFAAAPSQAQSGIPPSLITPDKVETRIGTLDFKDGMPSKATLDKVYDDLDVSHARRAFADTLQGVSIHAVAQGPAKRRREGQRGHGLLGADGRQVAVPDGQCRHHLHRRRPRPDEGADGARDAAAGARHGAGRLVPLGHRRRRARTRPRRRRQVPDRAAGLRGSAAGRRLHRRARPDQLRSCGSRVRSSRTTTIPNRWPSASGSSPRSIRTSPGGVGTPIAEFLAGKARLGPITPPPPTVFHEGSGKVMNTIPPNDWSVLRDAQRGRAAGTGHLARPGADGADRRHRHRQGQALRARRADEEDPDRGARARQRDLAQPVHEPARPELVLLPRLGLAELAVRHRLRVRDADPDDHAGGRQALPADRLPATGCASSLLLRRHRHHAGDGDAAARHRLALSVGPWSMPRRTTSTAPRPTR